MARASIASAAGRRVASLIRMRGSKTGHYQREGKWTMEKAPVHHIID